jgi:hypothetical protein
VASLRIVLQAARTLALSRLAAAAVAFALTGAPGLAGLLAGEAEHRCTCRTVDGVHECACARCHAAAAARLASEARTPPCHRAPPVRPAPAPKRVAGAPCWTGSCGAPDPAAVAPLALEVFTLPARATLPALPGAGRVTLPVGDAREVLLSPEPPPPRTA